MVATIVTGKINEADAVEDDGKDPVAKALGSEGREGPCGEDVAAG